MMDKPGKYGSGDIFGTAENFEGYRVEQAAGGQGGPVPEGEAADPARVRELPGRAREAHALMDKLKVAHEYRDGPARKHDWHSGWVREAVELLLKAK